MSVPETTRSVTAPAVRLTGLSVSARRGNDLKPLTFDTSFEVARGETLCVVGESGSGKSITVRALAGLLPPGLEAAGSALVDGHEMVNVPERSLRHLRGTTVSLLMQDPFTILNPLQTVRAHIRESLPAGAHEDELVARLAEVQIKNPKVLDRYPFQLSGGMRQRVALATALAKDPLLLIADEPTTALDATTQKEILDLIGRLQADRGMSVILVTHDLRLGFAYSDNVVVMYAGNIVECGSAKGIDARSAHPYTEGLLRSIPRVDLRAQLVGIPGTIIPAEETIGRCAFSNRCQWNSHVCVEAQPPLTQVGPEHYSACVRIGEIDSEVHARQVAVTSSSLQAQGRRAEVLRVTDLTKVFRDRRTHQDHHALKGVSLSIRKGQSLGVIGESGSGKTTLARCVLGLENATTGSIHINNTDASAYSRLTAADRRAVRRSVQCVFQDPYTSLNPARTVGSTLQEALDLLPAQRRGHSPADLLELVRLPRTYAVRKPSTLSGGERQRAAIARGLALNPELLICDEPVSALDVSVQAQILGVLNRAHAELGTAMLFITHDLGVVRQATDDVVVMYQGEIVEEGPTEAVLDDPRHEYTRRLLRALEFEARTRVVR
ncbi:dipeptide ABC transporter ATP-binding protein [Saccharopolyspora phatthalungensis]|uniref:Peptide/nickel transport system ATP-binding protein n=1 Tax=Saccharopolyspora phatthalungensis TaxID=664693 RepID=A0A840QK07_9PSEU|nr:ABC transporter ATP-binding protein [Saccharopolyspora phatthalungensis]MBB5159818.1 peptide/nickel transport system ATP-binding protein [Saccharopolyspora phatthalungensis]